MKIFCENEVCQYWNHFKCNREIIQLDLLGICKSSLLDKKTEDDFTTGKILPMKKAKKDKNENLGYF